MAGSIGLDHLTPDSPAAAAANWHLSSLVNRRRQRHVDDIERIIATDPHGFTQPPPVL